MTTPEYFLSACIPQDVADLTLAIRASGMYTEAEAVGLIARLPNLLSDPAQHWLRLDAGDNIAGAAWLSRDGLSDDVWSIRFIGLDAAHCDTGGGRAILDAADHVARSRGSRLMLIETPDAAVLDRARLLFEAAGYGEEARIRDFYSPGNAKIVFRKLL